MADLDPDDPFAGLKLRTGYDLAKRLLVALLLALVLIYVGYLAIALGPKFLEAHADGVRPRVRADPRACRGPRRGAAWAG
jgi:hypothetical protein